METYFNDLFTGFMWGDYVDIGNIYSFFSVNNVKVSHPNGMDEHGGGAKFLFVGGYGAYGFVTRNSNTGWTSSTCSIPNHGRPCSWPT
ncbi:MAG: hypothetical protein R2788_08935 [Saprospiraceae bacterium]